MVSRVKKFNRPPPVRFPSLGLFVKYGVDATITEALVQMMLYKRLQGRLPVPEVFGLGPGSGPELHIYGFG